MVAPDWVPKLALATGIVHIGLFLVCPPEGDILPDSLTDVASVVQRVAFFELAGHCMNIAAPIQFLMFVAFTLPWLILGFSLFAANWVTAAAGIIAGIVGIITSFF